jgi:hypothetical protein
VPLPLGLSDTASRCRAFITRLDLTQLEHLAKQRPAAPPRIDFLPHLLPREPSLPPSLYTPPPSAASALQALTRPALERQNVFPLSGFKRARSSLAQGFKKQSPRLRHSAAQPQPKPPKPPRKLALPHAGPAGQWLGQPGESGWVSNKPAVIQVTGGAPVNFSKCYPNFFPWAQASFTFGENELVGQSADMARADRCLAAEKGFESALAARKYRQKNALAWHHCEDARTLILLPIGLHGNVQHSGGASILRQKSHPTSP